MKDLTDGCDTMQEAAWKREMSVWLEGRIGAWRLFSSRSGRRPLPPGSARMALGTVRLDFSRFLPFVFLCVFDTSACPSTQSLWRLP